MSNLRTSLFADMMAIPAFFPALLRLVSNGEPVPIAAFATEVDIPIHDIEQWLRRQPGTDWDDQGRLLGFGLTQRDKLPACSGWPDPLHILCRRCLDFSSPPWPTRKC